MLMIMAIIVQGVRCGAVPLQYDVDSRGAAQVGTLAAAMNVNTSTMSVVFLFTSGKDQSHCVHVALCR